MPPLAVQPQALCKTGKNRSAAKGRTALALISIPCSTAPSKGGRELPALWRAQQHVFEMKGALQPCQKHLLPFLDHVVHLLWLYFFLMENSLAGQAGCESSSGGEARGLGASSSTGSSPCSLGLTGAELHFLFAAGKLQGTGIFRMFFINRWDSVKEIPDSAVSFSSACKQLCNFLNVC